MVMVYIDRCGALFGDGDKIKWQIGEHAVFHSSSHDAYNCTVVSHFVTHEAARDKRCLEVMFEDDGKTYTVLAERLEPRGGFPPAKRALD